MSGKVLIVGGGGREHAIAWKLAQSEKTVKIFAAPGSHAISQLPKTELVKLDIKKFENVANWCKENDIGLVVVGPEDPLAGGIADVLKSQGIQVFGPEQNGANIESNKDWSKAFMDRHGIPTAKWKSFTNSADAQNFIKNSSFPALVVKASGLAAGKGVIVAKDETEACLAADEILSENKFGTAGETVVVEELLQGEEVSVLAFCDGKTIKAMLPAQDHKRIFDNDEGPNTGGMGAYCPCPLMSEDQLKFVQKEVLERTMKGFNEEGIKYVGVLYAGLMLTPDGPKVLEFNCRFGDPETEVIMPMLDSDLYEVMMACCNQTLDQIQLKWKQNVSAVGVVMASRGYPASSSKGQVITGVEAVDNTQHQIVFHCGTDLKDGKLVTNGGRVLIAVALAPQLTTAAERATKACYTIKFDGAQFRKDIAHKAFAKSILDTGKLTYKESGVDISAGNDLVGHIKPAAKSTDRPGVMGGLGGFGGLFDTKLAGYVDPLLVSGTDGVGTKLKIAQEMGMHDTIGIDLVAMCVNDVLAHGAEPLFFLDYFACGALDVSVAKDVVSGVAEGCRQAGCSLVGGETAEMPDMYPPGEFDLAGFAVGAVERNELIPRISSIQEGDSIIALPSTGVHSNGFSLVRKIMKLACVSYKDEAPFSSSKKSFGEELLTPTKIYVKAVIPAMKTGKVKAFAHITGGGLVENIPRVLPKHLGVQIDANKWNIPPVFAWLAAAGGVNQVEMLRTFNCGVGGILVVNKSDEAEILKMVQPHGATVIGNIINRKEEEVEVKNFSHALGPMMKDYFLKVQSVPKKRVAVLISGSGTNLQALIDASNDRSMGCEIALVISNKAKAFGIERAKKAGIATKVLCHKDYPSREEFDAAMDEELSKFNIDLVCLAGFMRILSKDFTMKWRGKMINVHPALLPLFRGMDGAQQAIDAGVRISGCTVHFVEADVDAGAILVQEVVPVEVGDDADSLQKRIQGAEHKAFPQALKLLATGKVVLGENNKIVWN